jgi:hypothetical protein
MHVAREPTHGDGAVRQARDEAKAKIDRSAFVLTGGERPEFQLADPLDRTLQPLIPSLADYVRGRFIFEMRFNFKGVSHELYRRPIVHLDGISGDWLKPMAQLSGLLRRTRPSPLDSF